MAFHLSVVQLVTGTDPETGQQSPGRDGYMKWLKEDETFSVNFSFREATALAKTTKIKVHSIGWVQLGIWNANESPFHFAVYDINSPATAAGI